MTRLDLETAKKFYAEHKDRPFYGELTEFMVSTPVVLMALKGENAVPRFREVMGATNPEEAAEGTIRRLYGCSVGENSVHGSDSEDSASRELGFFFSASELP